MTDPAIDSNAERGVRRPSASRRPLWPWFIAGFLLVGIGMSFSVEVDALLPGGEGVVARPLWRHYLIEIRREWNAAGEIGPAQDEGSAALVTALQHVLWSSVGGGVMAGIVSLVRRRRARSNSV